MFNLQLNAKGRSSWLVTSKMVQGSEGGSDIYIIPLFVSLGKQKTEQTKEFNGFYAGDSHWLAMETSWQLQGIYVYIYSSLFSFGISPSTICMDIYNKFVHVVLILILYYHLSI